MNPYAKQESVVRWVGFGLGLVVFASFLIVFDIGVRSLFLAALFWLFSWYVTIRIGQDVMSRYVTGYAQHLEQGEAEMWLGIFKDRQKTPESPFFSRKFKDNQGKKGDLILYFDRIELPEEGLVIPFSQVSRVHIGTYRRRVVCVFSLDSGGRKIYVNSGGFGDTRSELNGVGYLLLALGFRSNPLSWWDKVRQFTLELTTIQDLTWAGTK